MQTSPGMPPSNSAAPPGWVVNPSSKAQRTPIVALALVGLAIGLAFTLREWGVIDHVWEWIRVRTPSGFPDRVIGAPWPELDVVGFSAVVVLTVLGRTDRWRSQWALTYASGIAIFLTAASSIVRWTAQYAVLHATSTLFVASTAAAIAMMPLAADELFAASAHRRFLRDGTRAATYEGPHHSHVGEMCTHWSGYVAGFTGIVVGIWLLLAPAVVLTGRAAEHGRLLGAVVAAIGALSLAQVARPARWANAAIGLWLVVAPLGSDYEMMGAVHMVLVGFTLAIASSMVGDPTTAEPPHRV